ncbi:MAG: efflux RND transporter permease subunit [Treponema sp.]|jgi:multidrug efflux pump subunit AcrB|nr:efflux RND transporter permease subunit [Treponema sp.]
MQGLIILFVKRPVTVIMILSAVMMAALFALIYLPINRLPDFSVPRVNVETVYSGMAANEIRSLVTIPLEDSISPVKGLERIQSISRDNRSIISLDFRWGTDPMTAAVLVREAIDSVYPGLPEGVRKPVVTAGDVSTEAHTIITIKALNGNNEFARNLAEYDLRARLRRINGVGSIVLSGGEKSEKKISLDVRRLAAHGLEPAEFARMIARESSEIPAGNAREGNNEIVIVSSGKPDSVTSLSKLLLPASAGALTIEDVAVLSHEVCPNESIFFCNSTEVTALEIFRRYGADPLRLSHDIKKTIEEASYQFSRDAKIEIINDSTPALLDGIRSLLFSATLGAFAVISILFVFIRRIKYSLLIAFSIPFSAAVGICVLSLAGKSINSMSLSGLAMGIGLVSDTGVIVLDLLYRTFNENQRPGVNQISSTTYSIAGSSIASTLTTALVFIPIIILPGPIGSIYGDIAIALTASVFAGWFYAQFCLPSLFRLTFTVKSLKLLQIQKHPRKLPGLNLTNSFFKMKNYIAKCKTKRVLYQAYLIKDKITSIDKQYRNILLKFLRHPVKIFIIAACISLAGTLTLIMRPFIFINPDDSEEVQVSILFKPGTLLKSMRITCMEILSLLSNLPSIKNVYSRAGAEEEDIGRRANIDYKKEELVFYCIPNKGSNIQNILTDIKSVMLDYHDNPYQVYFPKNKIEILLGLSQESSFVLSAKDRDELKEHIDIFEHELTISNIQANFRPTGQRAELRFIPNREAMAHLSMPATQLAETLYVINEGVIVNKLEIEGKPVDIRVGGINFNISNFDNENGKLTNTISTLEQMPIKTQQGKIVYLGSLGNIERREEEAFLARLNRSDVVYVDIITGKKFPAVLQSLSSRYSWFFKADESIFIRYRDSLLIYIVLVLFLLYMVMGAQFESFLLPLILMLSIPFSLAGAGTVLFLSGSRVDSGAVLGLIALFGLVVNNSLVLYEITNEKINLGFSALRAVIQGARERFQAIVITTCTTVFALLPVVLNPVGNSQKSMAAAMLGGLSASTVLSLFVIPPVLISYFKWKAKNKADLI